MELQNFINANTNFLSLIKESKFKINNYKDLKIISYPYDNPPQYNSNELWKLYCKGAVINTNNNKVICLPPVKAIEIKSFDDINHNNDDNYSYENLLDGTMINLFYHNNEWLISTRSEIGGYNKWNNKKSFRKMFNECHNINYETLNKEYSYSFIMNHIENRNVSPVYENQLILIEVFDINNNIKLNKSDFPSQFNNIDTYTDLDLFMNMYKGPVIPYYIKGFTVRHGNLRYKWINPFFNEIKNLKINMNNHLLNYIELRRNNNLKKYLKYFPEHQHLFNEYRNKIHELSNELFTIYKNVFIYKKLQKNEIPYHLKPLIYDIHKIYLSNKTPIHWETIKDYIHNVPSKKLTFSLNYC